MAQQGAGGTVEIRPGFPAPGATDEGVWQAELDGQHCRTTKEFLISAGVVLGFPAYYGRNWDAFYECFSDLLEVTTGGMGYEFYDRPGRSERTLHLVVRRAEQLLADAEPRDLGVLMWLLRNPRPHYNPPQLWHRYAELRVTFVCVPAALAAFRKRLDIADEFRHDGVM